MAEQMAFIDIETTYDPSCRIEKEPVLIITKKDTRYYEVPFDEPGQMVKSFWETYEHIDCPPLAAHNGIRFDFKYLLAHQNVAAIRQHGAAERPFAWEFWNRGRKCYWYDTVSIVPAKLAKIGEVLGLPKGDAEFYAPGEKIDTSSQKYLDLVRYCRRDCDILQRYREFYPSWIRQKKTAASTALHYMFAVSSISRFTGGGVDMAYRGGLTECFRPSGDNIVVLDINSSYPHSMLTLPDPYVQPTRCADLAKNRMGVYFCHIDKMREPFSPVGVYCNRNNIRPMNRGKPGGVLKYLNVRKADLWLSTPEVEWLQANNISFTVKYGFDAPTLDISDKVKRLYALRHDRKELAAPIKIILNSCYGKFGQRDEQPITVIGDKKLDDDAIGRLLSKRELKTVVQKDRCEAAGVHTHNVWTSDRCRYRNTLVAANITGRARINLINFAGMAGDGNVLYADTDSLFLTDSGAQALASFRGSALGQLKEEETAEHARIYARKCYKLDGILNNPAQPTLFKLKGAPRWVQTKISETGMYTASVQANGWREGSIRELYKTGHQNASVSKTFSMDLRRYRDFSGMDSKPYVLNNYREQPEPFAQTRLPTFDYGQTMLDGSVVVNL